RRVHHPRRPGSGGHGHGHAPALRRAAGCDRVDRCRWQPGLGDAGIAGPERRARLLGAGGAAAPHSLPPPPPPHPPSTSNTAHASLPPPGTPLTSHLYAYTTLFRSSGAYTILVDQAAAATGTVTLQLYDVPPDVTGSIVVGGSPVSVTLASPGQNAALTFNGQAGQQLSLRAEERRVRETGRAKKAREAT